MPTQRFTACRRSTPLALADARLILTWVIAAAGLLTQVGRAQQQVGPAFASPPPQPGAQASSPRNSQAEPRPFLPVPQHLSGVLGAGEVQPVQHTKRDERPPLDRRIAAMPNDHQKLEIIHRRSQLILTHAAVRRFAVTDPSIIDVVTYSPEEFSVIGNSLGTTDLMIWFEGEEEPLMYLVTVIPDPSLEERRRIDYGKIERRLAVLYPNSKVYLIPMSRKIIVRGQARDPEEAARIMQIVRGEVYTQDGGIFLGYTPGDPGAAGNDLNDLDRNDLLSTLIVNELQVPGEYQINIRVRIAELNRAMLREYGLDWNALIQISGDQINIGTALGGSNIFNFTGTFEDVQITTLLRALASNGTVKILQDATLTTMSGEPAAFLAGGEFAVPSTVGIGGAAVGTTTFRGFGTSIIATPTIIDHDLIRLRVVPELSSLNPQNAVGGVPGVDVKRVQTQVELREGQSIVLGGLFGRSQSAEQTRIPLLGELPIIGPAVFTSKRASEDETELLIVVTPEIVRPIDADQEPPLPGWYVTHPDDVDLYKLSRTEGNPDLSHNQLLPYGNGSGVAYDTGYSIYNPAPSGGLNPVPTGAYGGYGYEANFGAMGGTMYGSQPPAGNYGNDPYSGYAPQGQYGGPGYSPAPPMTPQPQYGPLPAPVLEPTPADPAMTLRQSRSPHGIQQTSGQQAPRRMWRR